MSRESTIASRVCLAATFAQYEQALRQHDWTYTYSDDGSVYRGGEAQADRIHAMAKELVVVDPDRTADLYNKYGRLGWGNVWEDVTADHWLDQHRYEASMKVYHKTLEMEIRKFGRQLGQVMAGNWHDTGWVGVPQTFTLLVRRPDGAQWRIGMGGWKGGTHLDIWGEGGLLVHLTLTDFYSVLDGLSPAVLSKALERMYQELLRRGVI